MSYRKRVDGSELLLGILALATSAGYLYEASHIPESLLADSVGAKGVPIAIGWVMAAAGAILCGRSVFRHAPTADSPSAEPDNSAEVMRHLLAVGLLAILAVYVSILPYAGYIVSTAILVGAAARFAGASFGRTLLFVAIGGSVALWLLFDPLLGISLPLGSWWGGR